MAHNVVAMSKQFFRKPKIVGIEPGDPIAASQGSAPVAGRGSTLILLAHINDRKQAGGLLNDFCRTVGRAVVDNDQFDRRTALLTDAFDRLANIERGVEC